MLKEIKDMIHWQQMLVIVFAVAIFCFWGYIRPAQVVGREAFQLFLYNGDYLQDRLSVPGGMARYVGEFIVQFFRFVTLGAFLSALLLVAIQWLSWVLLYRCLPLVSEKILFPISFVPSIALWYLLCDLDTSMTLPAAVLLTMLLMLLLPNKKKQSLICSLFLVPIGYWIAGPVVLLLSLYHLRWLRGGQSKLLVVSEMAALALLLVASVVVSSRFVPYSLQNLAKGVDYQMILPDKAGTYEELTYDYLLQLKDWDGIIKKSYNEEPKSLACRNVVRMAKYYRGQIGADELKENLLHTDKVLTSGSAAMMMSDVYLHMGFINISQRAAFEVMESSPNFNKSAREMSRLVETNLITGQYEVALKYIALLEETLFYRNWARQMRELATHPETIKDTSFYGELQKVYGQTVDVFFF